MELWIMLVERARRHGWVVAWSDIYCVSMRYKDILQGHTIIVDKSGRVYSLGV